MATLRVVRSRSIHRSDQSGRPRTLQRPGVFRPICSCKTCPSLVTSTTSPRPAPRRSKTRTGSPSGCPTAFSSWTTSIRSPWKLGCLTVDVTLPITRPSCIRSPPCASDESHPLDARRLAEEGGVLADQVFLDVECAVVALGERGLRERVDLPRVQPVAPVTPHGFHQLVEHIGHGEDLLLADAEQVVIERGAGDD